MNKKLKWALIINGFVVVIILTFIVMGGLAALLDLIQEIRAFSEGFITQIIEKLPIEWGLNQDGKR